MFSIKAEPKWNYYVKEWSSFAGKRQLNMWKSSLLDQMVSRKKIKLCTLLKHSFNNNGIIPSLPSFSWVLLKWHIQEIVSQTQEEARHIFSSALLFSCNGLLIETREVSKRGLKLSRVLWFDYGWLDNSIWRSRRPLRPQFTNSPRLA